MVELWILNRIEKKRVTMMMILDETGPIASAGKSIEDHHAECRERAVC